MVAPGRQPRPPKTVQSTQPRLMSATAWAKAWYDGFGCQFDQSRPDCQPVSVRSSASRKLKKAPAYGWQ
jgi:hypothetical protein